MALAALALEVGLGLLLVMGVRRLWVLVPAALLVGFFLFLTGRDYWRAAQGIEPPAACGCFGNLVDRTPAQAFWQDLLLLVPALALAFAGRDAGSPRQPWPRLAVAALGTAGAVAFAIQAPALPLDDFATRLKPGVAAVQLCAGREADRVCLATVLPEATSGSHVVVLADLADPATGAAVARLNQYALARRGTAAVDARRRDPRGAPRLLLALRAGLRGARGAGGPAAAALPAIAARLPARGRPRGAHLERLAAARRPLARRAGRSRARGPERHDRRSPLAHPASRPSLCLAAAPVAGQVPADPLLSGFLPVGEYLLEVDGKDQPSAQIYKSSRSATYLVISSALPSPVVIDPAVQSVVTVNMMKVAKQKDGSVSLLADAALADQGRFTIDDTDIAFSADGHQAKLKPRPPLLKQQTAQALLAYNPVYVRNAGAYSPDGSALRSLRSFGKPVRVQVFFGSWCPHCSTYVPHIIKVEEQLKGSKIQFEYYGLPQGPAMARDPEAKRLDVDQVPTGVVFVGGKEVGRIKGDGWRTPEATLKSMLEVGASLGG